ncbi:hypothetical protein ACFSUD_18285 [Sulfitobacter aestuarii]|uniref:Response regulatory domain-containing protein n=1 Tax=Sulfitobacter aestuarii TaxID=2161676 RepID=A0ABW5U6U5_9RHOB
MTFVVVEEDPFIRSDICEILQRGFPECRVSTLSLLTDLPDVAPKARSPLVAVVSTDRCDVTSALEALGDIGRSWALVLIGDFPAALNLPERRCSLVSRPFSSDTLLAAVKGAFSGVPSPA